MESRESLISSCSLECRRLEIVQYLMSPTLGNSDTATGGNWLLSLQRSFCIDECLKGLVLPIRFQVPNLDEKSRDLSHE